MDMVRLSIAGGFALAGVLTFASVAHRGHADPLPRLPQTRSDRAVAAAPVLVAPSTAARLRTHCLIQKMTVAARQIALMKVWAHRS